MGEPGTEMGSAKDLRGLDLGLKKAMASDLDGLKWRLLSRSQLSRRSVGKFVPIYSSVLPAYWQNDTMLLVFDRSGFTTLVTWREHVYCCVGRGLTWVRWEGEESILKKEVPVSQIGAQIGANQRHSKYIKRWHTCIAGIFRERFILADLANWLNSPNPNPPK